MKPGCEGWSKSTRGPARFPRKRETHNELRREDTRYKLRPWGNKRFRQKSLLSLPPALPLNSKRSRRSRNAELSKYLYIYRPNQEKVLPQ